MLCNMVLNGLEEVVHGVGPKRISKVHIIRYADDFVITAGSKEQLTEILAKVKEFLSQRGLNISEAKTRILNIEEEAFKFLG